MDPEELDWSDVEEDDTAAATTEEEGEEDDAAVIARAKKTDAPISDYRQQQQWRITNRTVSMLEGPNRSMTRDGIAVGMTVTTRLVLRIVTGLFLAWQIVLTVLFAANGYYDMSMFTYWNYTLVTGFFAFLFFALFYERWTLAAAVLFYLPLMLSTTFLVMCAIVIIVDLNQNIFLGDGSTSVARRHTGDFLIHVVPFAMIMILLTFNLSLYARKALGKELSIFRTRNRRYAYYAYWLLCGIVPFAIYMASFDVSKKYPTPVSTPLLFLALLALNLVWATITLVSFLASADFSIKLGAFWQRTTQREGLFVAPASSALHSHQNVRYSSNPVLGQES